MKLFDRYNVPCPRYTSYPTVPYWENNVTKENWHGSLKQLDQKHRALSLYIHLPYCASLCTYCACNTRITKNRLVQKPYVDTVLKEWNSYQDYFKNWTLDELHLGGGTPTFFDPEELVNLLAPILDSVKKGEDYAFSFEGHPENTSFEHLKVLRSLGFKRLSLGIQDFDDQVQKAINRLQSVKEVKRVVDQARSLLYDSINFDIVYGLPFQTALTVRDTINEVIQLRPDRIAYYSYAHVPWKKPGQRSYTKYDLPTGQEKRRLYELGREMLLDAGYQAIGMDHFALPEEALNQSFSNKTLHRNFMGYTPSKTDVLIGLGSSAISDIGLGLKQNNKTIEGYFKDIKEDGFSNVTGHLLNEEDHQVKGVVMAVMCGKDVVINEDFPISMDIIEERMGTLIEDQLVTIEGNKIHVTKQGEDFVRNIALVFDERYWAKQPAEKQFSDAV